MPRAAAAAIRTATCRGVTSGTSSSLGVRTVNWNRRLESTISGISVAVSIALLSGSLGEPAAGQPEVDVVERGRSGDDGSRQAKLADGGHDLAARVTVQRDGDGGADEECVVAGDPTVAQHGESRRGVAVDPQLQELASELLLELGGSAQRNDQPVVHDRQAVAEPLRLVEVVRGHESGQLLPALSPATRSSSSCRISGSRPTVGSSRNNTRGRETSARASSSRRRS